MTWTTDKASRPKKTAAVIELFRKGKVSKKEAASHARVLCEDGIVTTDSFYAVIDGSTSKGALRIDGKTPGRIAMEILQDAIRRLPEDIHAAEAIHLLTMAICHFYKTRRLYEEVSLHAENRMTASVVIYSIHHNEVWMAGDCLCRFNGVTHCNPKPTDSILAGIRADILTYYIRKGHSIENLQTRDLGREWIMPFLKEQCYFQNSATAGPFGYAVVDGFPLDSNKIRVLHIPPGTEELILASDGYSQLCDTLKETEQTLYRLLSEDPLCIRTYPSTKGLAGNASFDDRSYLRIKLH